MEWIAAKVVIQSGDKPQAIELITDIFYDLGVKGVQIEDPRLDPEEGWGADAVVQDIPPARVNDGYCDCPTTGADEPATEACAGREHWPGSPTVQEEEEVYVYACCDCLCS